MVPFIGSEALAAGVVNRYQLATRYDAVYRNVNVPRGQLLNAADRAVAAWLWSERQATAAGLSAAALHGTLWLATNLPAELNQRHRHKTDGILLHSDKLADDEVLCCQRCTGDNACPHCVRPWSTTRPDDCCHPAGCVDASDQSQAVRMSRRLPRAIAAHAASCSCVKLIDLSDGGAESPQETRTRLILTRAGLRPQRTQIEVLDTFGEYVRRIDSWAGTTGWSASSTTAHNTGPIPRYAATTSIRRPVLEALGWRIIRVSADMLRYPAPHYGVSRNGAALPGASAHRFSGRTFLTLDTLALSRSVQERSCGPGTCAVDQLAGLAHTPG